MSRTEIHKGKATPLNMDVFEFITKHPELIQLGYKDCDDIYEIFYNGLICGYQKYILIEDMVFELHNRELDSYGFSLAGKNADGSFTYFVSFYNGGCCLGEAIQEAVGNAT